ncbi:DUF2157 domain-containing protein [Helicobacter sp. 23-1044]
MISYKQKFLKDELENLTNDGFLSEVQKEKIFAHYGFAKSPQKATSSLLFVLSAVLFALSLLTLIGYNWEQIPAFIRTALLLGALLATQIALYFAQNKIYSISLGIFSNFVLLANLALLSQIYHLGDDSASALLGVAFVSLLMSFALKSGAIFYQSYIFAAIAFGINATDDILTHSFGIFIIFGFALQIFNGSKILAFFNFFALLFYLDFGLFGFDLPLNLFILFCVSFSLVFLAFNVMDYKIYALFVLACALLWGVNGFASAQDYMAFHFVSFWQISIMVAFLLPTLLNFAFKRYFLGILGVLFWLESFRILTIFATDSADFASYIFFAQVFYSFLSLIFGIYLIKNDYKILGILTIFALIIIRYINLLGDYIGASIIFAIFGAVVLFVARKKQKAVQK